MNALVFILFLASQNAACDSQAQTMTLSEYQDCVQSVRLDRHQAYHENIVGPALEKIPVLESWQFYIKLVLGIGGGGGVAVGARKGHRRFQRWRENGGTGDGNA